MSGQTKCIWLLILCCVLLMEGCKSANNKKRKIFHYNEHSGITSLDPAFAKSQALMWPAHQLFNTLVQVRRQFANCSVPGKALGHFSGQAHLYILFAE